MLCQRCRDESWSRGTPGCVRTGCRPLKCERCGAAILTVEGVAVGVGDDTLATLSRFGLANTGRPLLESRARPEGP